MNVGICEAKSKLSLRVEKVEAGEEVILARRGCPVAKIVNIAPAHKCERAQLLREIRALSRRVKIPKEISIRTLLRPRSNIIRSATADRLAIALAPEP